MWVETLWHESTIICSAFVLPTKIPAPSETFARARARQPASIECMRPPRFEGCEVRREPYRRGLDLVGDRRLTISRPGFFPRARLPLPIPPIMPNTSGGLGPLFRLSVLRRLQARALWRSFACLYLVKLKHRSQFDRRQACSVVKTPAMRGDKQRQYPSLERVIGDHLRIKTSLFQ
jgi:hypothetical protein